MPIWLCVNLESLENRKFGETDVTAVITARIRCKRRNTERGSSMVQSQVKHNRPDFYIEAVGIETLWVWQALIVYICYGDYQKAFDSVWRVGLWHIKRYLWYEEKTQITWSTLIRARRWHSWCCASMKRLLSSSINFVLQFNCILLQLVWTHL